MWHEQDTDQYGCDVLLAGQSAPAGMYRELGSGRLVQLESNDILPASFDGRIACYLPIRTWAQILASQLRTDRSSPCAPATARG